MKIGNIVMGALALTLLVATGCQKAPQMRTAHTSDPLVDTDAQVIFDMGKALAQAGDLVRAEQYLGAAAERGFPEAQTAPEIIDVCIRGKRYDSALLHARARLQVVPKNWRLRLVVATLHNALGHTQQARDELERIISEEPEKASDAHFLMGRMLRSGPDRQDAGSHFARYLELSPEGKHASAATSFLRVALRTQPAAVEVPVTRTQQPPPAAELVDVAAPSQRPVEVPAQ